MELFLNQSPPLTFLFGSAFWEEKQCMYQGQNTDLDLNIRWFQQPFKEVSQDHSKTHSHVQWQNCFEKIKASKYHF